MRRGLRDYGVRHGIASTQVCRHARRSRVAARPESRSHRRTVAQIDPGRESFGPRGQPVEVGFEIDVTGAGQGCADGRLGLVDARGDGGGVILTANRHLHGDQEFVRAHVQRLQMDDPIDGLRAIQCHPDRLFLFGQSGFARQPCSTSRRPGTPRSRPAAFHRPWRRARPSGRRR